MLFIIRWWYTQITNVIRRLLEEKTEPKPLSVTQIEYAVERARLSITMDAAQKMFEEERDHLTAAIEDARQMFTTERDQLAQAVDTAHQALLVKRERIVTLTKSCRFPLE